MADPAAYEDAKKSTVAETEDAMGGGYLVGLRMLSVHLQKVGIRFMNIAMHRVYVLVYVLVYTQQLTAHAV